MPSCIRDASPDAWGRRVLINRKLSPTEPEPSKQELSELTYLLESESDCRAPDSRMRTASYSRRTPVERDGSRGGDVGQNHCYRAAWLSFFQYTVQRYTMSPADAGEHNYSAQKMRLRRLEPTLMELPDLIDQAVPISVGWGTNTSMSRCTGNWLLTIDDDYHEGSRFSLRTAR